LDTLKLDEISRRIAELDAINCDCLPSVAPDLKRCARLNLLRPGSNMCVTSMQLLKQIPVALYLSTLGLSATLCLPAMQAMAARATLSTVQIFLYENGVPVNVTSVDSYYAPHVYDAYGNLIGTVGANNVIYNTNNQNIGYITETNGD
jgi:hypothetical protein